MILETTYDLYRAFLSGINKAGSFSIGIDAFNELINNWGQDEWLDKNVIKPEIDQTMIDRLSVLKVVTDGEFTYSDKIDGSSPWVLEPILNNKELIPPGSPESYDYFQYPLNGEKEINNVKYPPYMRLLNVMFKVEYEDKGDCDEVGESDWMRSNVLRSDNEVVNEDNPFRKPTMSRLYHELIGDSIKLVHGAGIHGKYMKIKYFRYPRKIFLNELSTNPTDEQTGVPDYTGTGTNGSVNCELPGPIKREIIDLLVRIFLERVQDPRYQSYLNELNIKNNG